MWVGWGLMGDSCLPTCQGLALSLGLGLLFASLTPVGAVQDHSTGVPAPHKKNRLLCLTSAKERASKVGWFVLGEVGT